MIGAIIGDIVGSRFEFHNYLSRDFRFLTSRCRFTDDTVMTCAVAAKEKARRRKMAIFFIFRSLFG